MTKFDTPTIIVTTMALAATVNSIANHGDSCGTGSSGSPER